VEEGNVAADVDLERQRKDVVVMERAMQRSPRGLLIRSLAWLHPRRIHPLLVLASCWMRAMHRATSRPGFSRFFNKITPRDRDGINTAALFSYAHILRCALLGNSPSQSPPTSPLFLVLLSPILSGSLPYLVPSADCQPRECVRRAVPHSFRC
jgi:hypothetical protein